MNNNRKLSRVVSPRGQSSNERKPASRRRSSSMRSSTNSVILDSIPLNREMKGYWVRKYERIAVNCGTDEAVAKFKNLRVQVLRYLSSKNRASILDECLSSTGFRQNGYLRMLFEYALTQPHFVLSFLKLYTAPAKSSMTADQAAGATYKRLSQVKANEAVPKWLREWLLLLSMKPSRSWRYVREHPGSPMRHLYDAHSYQEWVEYWCGWYAKLQRGWKSPTSGDYKLPFPEIYKDYEGEGPSGFTGGDSKSFRADFADLVSMHHALDPIMGFDAPLSKELLEFVDGFLDESVSSALWETMGAGGAEMLQYGGEPFFGLFTETSMLSGHYVGHVQHIHKKGGGTDLRDIAVPNRFIQLALAPAADRLYEVVRQLPHDATFNQDKFDTRIANRVNNDELYQGSVDLSKATDNLPLNWGDEIVLALGAIFSSDPMDLIYYQVSKRPGFPVNPEGYRPRKQKETGSRQEGEWSDFWMSYKLFQTVARANWEDEGYFIRWKVGQPLGSLPSFAMLALTHNLLLESLGASLGLMHSPYVILGDDLVVFNRKLRSAYIRELSSRGIPLSLHKSYDGRLSEFAGKTYVKGSIPFYCSDHNPVTFNNLLDFQRATGIRIPWNVLPKDVRRKIAQVVANTIGNDDTGKPLSWQSTKVKQLAISSYDLVQMYEVCGKGSHIYPVKDSEEVVSLVSKYVEYREATDDVVPESEKRTGLVLLGASHPLVLLSTRYADHDGFFKRFRPIVLPAWYREKFRPCATDTAIRAACQAVMDK